MSNGIVTDLVSFRLTANGLFVLIRLIGCVNGGMLSGERKQVDERCLDYQRGNIIMQLERVAVLGRVSVTTMAMQAVHG